MFTEASISSGLYRARLTQQEGNQPDGNNVSDSTILPRTGIPVFLSQSHLNINSRHWNANYFTQVAAPTFRGAAQVKGRSLSLHTQHALRRSVSFGRLCLIKTIRHSVTPTTRPRIESHTPAADILGTFTSPFHLTGLAFPSSLFDKSLWVSTPRTASFCSNFKFDQERNHDTSGELPLILVRCG